MAASVGTNPGSLPDGVGVGAADSLADGVGDGDGPGEGELPGVAVAVGNGVSFAAEVDAHPARMSAMTMAVRAWAIRRD
jgi:hypothetical protein